MTRKDRRRENRDKKMIDRVKQTAILQAIFKKRQEMLNRRQAKQ